MEQNKIKTEKEGGSKGAGGGELIGGEGKCSHLPDAEETVVKVSMSVRAAGLLPTSPTEAQERKALEGKPKLKVTFN